MSISVSIAKEILREEMKRGATSQYVASQISRRICEGWFGKMSVQFMEMALNICGQEISEDVKRALLLMFDIVPDDDLKQMVKLYTTYRSKLIEHTDYTFIARLYNKVLEHGLEALLEIIKEYVMELQDESLTELKFSLIFGSA